MTSHPLTQPVPNFDSIDLSLLDTADATASRDEVVAAVESHAGTIARELARLHGGDYGSHDFDTARGTWTVKYEGGDLQYLRYDGGPDDVYVVSQHAPPAPDALAEAMRDYADFVAAYNERVERLEGVLDSVELAFPAVAPVDAVVTERDRILDEVREHCTEMARALYRLEGDDYGTFTTRLGGTRWELKRERDTVSYLRVGGEGGIYLLSQYRHPSATDVRELAGDLPAFVDAFNDHVATLEGTLSGDGTAPDG